MASVAFAEPVLSGLSEPPGLMYWMCFPMYDTGDSRVKLLGLSEGTYMRAMVLVLPDGRIFVGSEALPMLLRTLKGWRWLAYALAIPGIRPLTRLLYNTVARNRYTLSCIVGRKGGANDYRA